MVIKVLAGLASGKTLRPWQMKEVTIIKEVGPSKTNYHFEG